MPLLRAALSALALALALLAARPADAHAARSAYVEVVEREGGVALVTVRAQVPVTGLRLLARAPCAMAAAEAGALALACPGGTVAGATIEVEGLGSIVGEAVVWAVLVDGSSSSSLLTPSKTECTLPRPGASALAVARQYAGAGVRHIVGGFDHLLFLLGLVVVLRRARAVLLAETAFTLSHTLSFTAAALGWVRVPAAPVEACIALSLVLVALDARGAPPADAAGSRGPLASVAWRGAGLAFVFGLVHGLGFAGGLSEAGLPERAIPAALAGFAAGVEVGQVAFLAAVLAVFALARRARGAAPERWLAAAAAYAVGGVGFFWLIERVRALLLPIT